MFAGYELARSSGEPFSDLAGRKNQARPAPIAPLNIIKINLIEYV